MFRPHIVAGIEIYPLTRSAGLIKSTPFCWKSAFLDPLPRNARYAFRMKKDPFLRVFLDTHVYTNISECPPPPRVQSYVTMESALCLGLSVTFARSYWMFGLLFCIVFGHYILSSLLADVLWFRIFVVLLPVLFLWHFLITTLPFIPITDCDFLYIC